MHCIVLEKDDSYALEQEINENLRKGYTVSGNVAVCVRPRYEVDGSLAYEMRYVATLVAD